MVGSPRHAAEIRVFISSRSSVCDECSEELGKRAWITLTAENEVRCLSCADLDHLAFLPSGDVALTRRSKKYSSLHAVVLRWSRARKRYERQGLLVEEPALAEAEAECLADADARRRRQEREAVRRAERDGQFVTAFAAEIRRLFPGMPPEREQTIAEFACRKHSGRVGRTAAARELDEQAVRLAVVAHIRHTETPYDSLLNAGIDRDEARREVGREIATVLKGWQSRASGSGESAVCEGPRTRRRAT